MIYLLKGKVELLRGDSIILNVHDVGYQIFVSHVDKYKTNDEVTIYIYNVIKEDINYFVGFSFLDEKAIFLDLIKVNGLGPKSVLNALRVTTPEEVKKAISCGNISFLKKLPSIGAKAAQQIVLDLKEKFPGSSEPVDSKLYDEAKNALIGLGFKKIAIERVLSNINEPDLTVEELIRIAIAQLKN